MTTFTNDNRKLVFKAASLCMSSVAPLRRNARTSVSFEHVHNCCVCFVGVVSKVPIPSWRHLVECAVIQVDFSVSLWLVLRFLVHRLPCDCQRILCWQQLR